MDSAQSRSPISPNEAKPWNWFANRWHLRERVCVRFLILGLLSCVIEFSLASDLLGELLEEKGTMLRSASYYFSWVEGDGGLI